MAKLYTTTDNFMVVISKFVASIGLSNQTDAEEIKTALCNQGYVVSIVDHRIETAD